jgi:hypothetical protein
MDLAHQVPNCFDGFQAPASIMNTNTDGCNHMTNLAEQPLPSDAIAIVNSVYGNTPKKICQ